MKRVTLLFPSTVWHRWVGHASSGFTKAFCLLACAITFVAAVLCATDSIELEKLIGQTRSDRTDLAMKANALRPPLAKKLRARDEMSEHKQSSLQQVVRLLNTPWQTIFQTLERQTKGEVALILVEPDAKKSEIKIIAEGRSLDDLFTYAQRLENEDPFGRLTFVKHDTNEQDATKPLRLAFHLQLTGTQPLGSDATKDKAATEMPTQGTAGQEHS